jgi:hypothetical protein
MQKYGKVGQATYDNIIRRMRFACWITKDTDTHSEYAILLSTATMVMRTRLTVTFIRTLPVLFLLNLISTHLTCDKAVAMLAGSDDTHRYSNTLHTHQIHVLGEKLRHQH